MKGDLNWKMTQNKRQPPIKYNLKWKSNSNEILPPMENILQNQRERQPPMGEDI